MRTIQAVFENGVFRPTEPVELPEHCRVEFEPRIVNRQTPSPSLDDVYAILEQRTPNDPIIVRQADITTMPQRPIETKAYRVEDIRRTHPNAYVKWSREDDQRLGELYRNGKTVAELAVMFARKQGAIRSRLLKLGLVVEVTHMAEHPVSDPSEVHCELDELDEEASELVDIPVRTCAQCDGLIPPERLEAVPETTLCIKCQQGKESQHDNSRVTDIECPRCAARGIKSRLVWRTARDPSIPGYFLGCSLFPECRYVDRS